MIAHDGIPVFALVLKSSGFSFKARYVNDVHLPRFSLVYAGRRDADGTDLALYETATRSQMHCGRFKGCLPLEQLE